MHGGNRNLQDTIRRASEGNFREYWLQLYIRDNYSKLGFESLDGPFDTGYDFKGIYEGKRVVVEAETQSKNFLYHKHDPDRVDILIVLNDDTSGTVLRMSSHEWRKRLPKKIIKVDPEDFVKSTYPMRKEYAEKKQCERKAFEGLFPFLNIKSALSILWGLLIEELPLEDSPEAEAFGEALDLTAMEYIKIYDLNIEERGTKPIFSNIEVLANDLVRSRKELDDLADEEREHLKRWLGILQTEYSFRV